MLALLSRIYPNFKNLSLTEQKRIKANEYQNKKRQELAQAKLREDEENNNNDNNDDSPTPITQFFLNTKNNRRTSYGLTNDEITDTISGNSAAIATATATNNNTTIDSSSSSSSSSSSTVPLTSTHTPTPTTPYVNLTTNTPVTSTSSS